MHNIAKEFNQILSNTTAMSLLSDLGRRMYFPKGIVSQEAEAGIKAKRIKATVGMATKGSDPLYLDSIYRDFKGLEASKVFPYASTAGDPELREVWKQAMIEKNPDLKGKNTSLPLVCSGLTHGISLTADLFIDAGDTVLVPDMFWGNYRLIIEERREARIETFPFYTAEKDGMNLKELDRAIARQEGEKVVLIVNFPNNPSGYSPTNAKAAELVDILTSYARKGKKILVITDDAYFGLFFEDDIYRQSLFAPLADAHENILAVKIDGATKEDFVWGFRVGFVTYGSKGLEPRQYEVLEKKTMGAVRSSISNSSRPAQSLLLKGLKSETYLQEKQQAFDLLKERYLKVKEILEAHRDDENLIPLPFNSGYFMAFTCRGDAEKLRVYLLDTYEVGTIAIQSDYLRIAFSSVDIERLEELYSILYQAAAELWS